MDTVQTIYELIQKDNSINTFNNNKELFYNYYLSEIDFVYHGPEALEVAKYVLSLNLDDENEEYPYINSRIFSAFNHYEQVVTQTVYISDKYGDDYVDKIYKLIDDYYFIAQYKENASLHPLYKEDAFIRDCTGSMMILLNSSFFDISNNNIKKMIESITNNKHLTKIIESGNSGKALLDKEYLYDYVTRYLFSSFFFNPDGIDNDEFMIAFKEGKITDRQTLTKIINNINKDFLLLTFDNNLSMLLDAIEKSIEDEVVRLELFKNVVDKLFSSGDFQQLMNFMMDDSRCDFYLDSEHQKAIMTYYPYSEGVILTDKEVNYILDNAEDTTALLHGLKKDLHDNDWSEETRKRVEEVTKNTKEYNINKDQAIQILDEFFRTRKGVDLDLFIEILRVLVKDYCNDDGLKLFCAFKPAETNGVTYSKANSIGINIINIAKMIREADSIEQKPELIWPFVTLFHEGRHIIQFKEMNNDEMDPEIYEQYKEELIGSLVVGYYEKNYHGVTFERDARIHGAHGVVELLTTYFPYMEKCIDYYKKVEQKEIEDVVQEKEIFELSGKITVDDALEKIISINPSIVERYTGLQKEYGLDGKKLDIKKDKTI